MGVVVSAAVLAFLSGSAALRPSAAEIDEQEDAREARKEAMAESDRPGAELARERVSEFVFAGKATFTVVSKRTGERFTFRVARPDEESPFFVSVLNGPDNGSDYAFLGTIFSRRRFVHGKKSKVGIAAPSAKAFAWFFKNLAAGYVSPECEVWHMGACGKCGRALSVPESIARGLGPDCAGAS